ncbi:hypothetical protein PRK78_001400 [Emydomyces testavorans]|uniref:Phosphoribosyltransferase domain-containing protein n=1 Tax=Emydomyces testavorans TaxID=2070801 RepID=A0AAF0DCT9_9EURO|nr:hypothetical protein PRK78_001400 [Emydomyces testavorans]
MPRQTATSGTRSASLEKAVVVGLYGVSGSGKTFLLDQLKEELSQEHFAFYEGSKMIAAVVPGGLSAFQNLEEHQKVYWRQHAIDKIKNECIDSGKSGVVTGHLMFWPEGEEEEDAGQPVYTENDLDIFTHILYLDVPAEIVLQRRLDDTERSRPRMSVSHLRKWQQAEKAHLQRLCRAHGILFALLSPPLMGKISMLLRDFQQHNEQYNLSRAESRLDEIFATGHNMPETVLVMDADRTLAAEDTGSLFWKGAFGFQQPKGEICPLKDIFSGPLGYSYTAFRQATLLYEETADDQEFDTLCENVASEVTMYPEFVALLRLLSRQNHVCAVIVTCGLRRVWDKVLEREGLSKRVKVIGGGRIADGFVVTAAVKGALIARLQDTHRAYVWAFGDSPLDLNMLSKADEAIVVVGEERTRSKSMDAALINAISNGGLRARQVVLPKNAPPRYDTTKLPIVQLTEDEFINSILCRRNLVVHATNRNAAKLLMTPMRDAKVAGPVLREAHRRAGWYLATEFLADIIGVEEWQIPHVQGHHTSGYRLLHERETVIVALMRGGEPMALGISDVFPLAMFVHASCSSDIKNHHLQGKLTVILVDSVVNSGKTVLQFVQHIRNLHNTIRIVVVAGVVQAQCVSGGGLTQELARYAIISTVALRLSENKFSGKGTTDTGNRLFNTTHLP